MSAPLIPFDPISATISALTLAFMFYQHRLQTASANEKSAIVSEIEQVRDAAELLHFGDNEILTPLRKLSKKQRLSDADNNIIERFENDQANVLESLETLEAAAAAPTFNNPSAYNPNTRELLNEVFRNKGQLRKAVWPVIRSQERGEKITPEKAQEIIHGIEPFNANIQNLIDQLNALIKEHSNS